MYKRQDADSYDPKYAKWRYDDLPILPEYWQMVVGKDKKKQFDILKKLMNAPDVSEVVNACDAPITDLLYVNLPKNMDICMVRSLLIVS